MSARFSCAEVERFGDAWLDGEFGEDDRAGLEAHVAACPACAERLRFQAAFRRAVREAAPRAALPDGLRERIAAAVAAEPAPAMPRLPAALTRSGRVARLMPPVAVAAGLAASLVFGFHRARVPGAAGDLRPAVADVIAPLQRGWPVEVHGGPEAVRAWFGDKLGFPVRPPPMPPGAVLVGARLARVRDRDAALLFYDVGGERISVLVFDPGAVDAPLEARRRRSVGHRELFLDGQRGYHVAAYRDRDLAYTFTSDMDEERMIDLVSTTIQR